MISARRIITITGTLFCALATGFLMQHVLVSDDQRQAARSVQVASVGAVDVLPLTVEEQDAEPLALTPVIEEDIEVDNITLVAGVPVPPSSAPQPALLPDTPVTLAALDDQPIGVLPREEPVPSFTCELKVHALPIAAAMVQINIDTPCLVEERFTLHHNGMMISGLTDGDGLASIDVPALSEQAVFIITFATGESAVAKAEVTSVEYYDRAIVQWSGPDGLQVHALEYGAGYGEDGHVWAGAMADMSVAAKGEGGFIMRLGEDVALNPQIAEVYTFPTGTAINIGSVVLSVEAEVTAENCGRDLEAQVLQKSGDQPMKARDLTLAMPDCDAVGDFLVLKNLFDDLNIARN
jgi:hypothetical protein